MISEDRFTALVTGLQEAAAAPEAWIPTLTALGDAFDGSACGFTVHDPTRKHTEVSVSTRLDPGGIDRYNEHFHKVDLFTQTAMQAFRAGQVVCPSHERIERLAMERSEFYNDFLASQNIFFNLGGVLGGSGPAVTCVSFLRSERRGPYSAEECELLLRLIPHLRRAIHLHRLLRTAEVSRFWRESIRDGVVFVSASGAVLDMNLAARRMVAAGDGLSVSPKGLLELSSAGTAGWRGSVTSENWASGNEREQWTSLLADHPQGCART